MKAPTEHLLARPFKPDTIVTLPGEPIRPSGPAVELERSSGLGPGIVRESIFDGKVPVHWIEPDFDAWMEPQDIREVQTEGRLISIYRCLPNEHRRFLRHKLVAHKGLEHNWTVELRPDDVIRAVRSDGLAWTYDWHLLTHRIERHGTVGQPPIEDDDAESLTAVELAMGLTGWDSVYGAS